MNVTALTNLAIAAYRPEQLRRIVKADGHTNPVGSANAKTATPSTYRPVGDTCPTSCPQFPRAGEHTSCLALSGNVALHQKRALPLWQSSVRAAIIAMVGAARWGNPARLHVSGDFFLPDGVTLDEQYIGALSDAANIVKQHFKATWVAWTYTHATPEQFGFWRERFVEVGIALRFSGQPGDWGALVTDSKTPGAEARRLGATYCPEQAAADVGKSVTCVECTLCWTRSRSILFRPSNGARPNPDTGEHREGT